MKPVPTPLWTQSCGAQGPGGGASHTRPPPQQQGQLPYNLPHRRLAKNSHSEHPVLSGYRQGCIPPSGVLLNCCVPAMINGPACTKLARAGALEVPGHTCHTGRSPQGAQNPLATLRHTTAGSKAASGASEVKGCKQGNRRSPRPRASHAVAAIFWGTKQACISAD